jgi:imidazolonepropionase-like amidohydrolase
MAVKVRGVGHLVLRVRELDRSLAFYVDLLGLEEVARRDFGEGPMVFLSGGATHHDLALVEVGSTPGPGSLHHLALKVGDGVDELAAAKRSLIDAGAAVAIASNFNPHRTPTWNMQAVIAIACHELGMTPAEAIAAATINGAHALARADRLGSLTPGKDADVILLNTDDYRDLGRYFGVNLVHVTIKRGVVIYREGELRGPGG